MNSNKQISKIILPGNKAAVPNNLVVLGADDVSCLRQHGNVENIILSDNVNYLAYERMLGLMENPKLLVSIGQALPLMISFIRRCAGQNSCQVMYPALMEELGVSGGTIKNWGRHLEEIGLIAKSAHSVKGIMVTLTANILSKPSLIKNMELQVQKTIDILTAIKTTTEHTVSAALQDIKQNRLGES